MITNEMLIAAVVEAFERKDRLFRGHIGVPEDIPILERFDEMSDAQEKMAMDWLLVQFMKWELRISGELDDEGRKQLKRFLLKGIEIYAETLDTRSVMQRLSVSHLN